MEVVGGAPDQFVSLSTAPARQTPATAPGYGLLGLPHRTGRGIDEEPEAGSRFGDRRSNDCEVQ